MSFRRGVFVRSNNACAEAVLWTAAWPHARPATNDNDNKYIQTAFNEIIKEKHIKCPIS